MSLAFGCERKLYLPQPNLLKLPGVLKKYNQKRQVQYLGIGKQLCLSELLKWWPRKEVWARNLADYQRVATCAKAIEIWTQSFS